jgi:hypothetical protein
LVIRLLVFDALLLVTCAYALWRGGAPERIASAAMLLAYLGTLASYGPLASRFAHVETGVLAVDTALLIVLVTVALKADRAWPMALAALQLDSVGVHLARLLDLEMIRVTYALMLAMWSYPMLLLLVAGTWRHGRRSRRDGGDLAWSQEELS